MTSTRRTRRTRATPSGGQVPTSAMPAGGRGRQVFQVLRGLSGGQGRAHPRAGRELGQPVERLELYLGEKRDHQHPGAGQDLLHLRQMEETRDGGVQRPAGFCRRTVAPSSPSSTLSTRTGRWASSSRARSRAPGECTPRGGPRRCLERRLAGPRPGSGRPPPGRRRSSRGRRPGYGVVQEPLPKGGGRPDGGAGATNTPFPRRASTYPLRLRSSMTRATVLALMPRNPASSRMLGRAWSRGTPPPSMTCFVAPPVAGGSGSGSADRHAGASQYSYCAITGEQYRPGVKAKARGLPARWARAELRQQGRTTATPPQEDPDSAPFPAPSEPGPEGLVSAAGRDGVAGDGRKNPPDLFAKYSAVRSCRRRGQDDGSPTATPAGAEMAGVSLAGPESAPRPDQRSAAIVVQLRAACLTRRFMHA